LSLFRLTIGWALDVLAAAKILRVQESPQESLDSSFCSE
jgi:hypothetical protein